MLRQIYFAQMKNGFEQVETTSIITKTPCLCFTLSTSHEQTIVREVKDTRGTFKVTGQKYTAKSMAKKEKDRQTIHCEGQTKQHRLLKTKQHEPYQ